MLELISYANRQLVLHYNGEPLSPDNLTYQMFESFFTSNYGFKHFPKLGKAIELYNENQVRGDEVFILLKENHLNIVTGWTYFVDYITGVTDTTLGYIYNVCPDDKYVPLLALYEDRWNNTILSQLDPKYYQRLDQFFSEGLSLRYTYDLRLIQNSTHNFEDNDLRTSQPYCEERIILSFGYMLYIPTEYALGAEMMFYNKQNELLDTQFLDSYNFTANCPFNGNDIQAIGKWLKEKEV